MLWKNLNELFGQPSTKKRIYNTEIDTDAENKLMVTKGGKLGRDTLGDWDRHVHTTIYTIGKKDLLCSTENRTHYSVMAYMGTESKKRWLYVCVYIYNRFTLLYS